MTTAEQLKTLQADINLFLAKLQTLASNPPLSSDVCGDELSKLISEFQRR